MFNGELAVAYCLGINHAKEMENFFLEDNVAAAIIYGKQNMKEQQEILGKYERGEIKVLCNADILIAGFDEKKASVCLNLAPTLSPVVAEQRGGRVLRLDDDNENKHATIVDFVDKNNNKKTQPITFAEIANASVVYKKEYPKDNQVSTDSREKVERVTQDIKIEGVQIINDSEEVMKVIHTIMQEKAEPAPDGWLTNHALAKILNKKPAVIRKYAGILKSQHLEWFRVVLDRRNVAVEHYSPELIEIIKELTGELAPGGWFIVPDLAQELGRAGGTIKSYAEKFRSEYPEWFKSYPTPVKRRLGEYYAPELVKKIKEALGGREKAPKDWLTKEHIRRKLGLQDDSTGELIKECLTLNPSLGKKYLSPIGHENWYYSPVLVEKINEVLTNRETDRVPKGWMSKERISRNLGIKPYRLTIFIKPYTVLNPEWIKVFLSKAGREITYYSPELIEKIKEEIKKEI